MKLFNYKLIRIAIRFKPLWYLFGIFLRVRPKAYGLQPKSILVLDFHRIGDIVLLIPLLRALREAYPSARIVLVAGPWAKELLYGEKIVDEIVPFSAPWVKYNQGLRGYLKVWRLVRRLRNEVWDIGIEVRGDIRQILLLLFSGAKRRVGFDFTGGRELLTDVVPDDGKLKHLAAHHRHIAEYLGIWLDNQDYVPVLHLTDDEQKRAMRIPRYIGIHLWAAHSLREFEIKDAIVLVDKIATCGCSPIVVFSTQDDSNKVEQLINLMDGALRERIKVWEGPLRDFIVMASRASHFFCMDSGPAHIVAALGVPVTVFFGPNCPEFVKPLGDNVQIIENKEIYCRPCDQKKCVNQKEKACLIGLAEKWMEI